MHVKCVATILAHPKAGIVSISLTHDSIYCITCGEDGTVGLWNPWKQLLIKRFEGVHSSAVTSACITQSRSQLVTTGKRDSNAFLWDIPNAKVIRRLGRHDKGILSSHLFSSDNLLLTSGSDKTVAIWDLRERHQNRKPVQLFHEALDDVLQCQYLELQSEIVTVSLDGFLRTYDLRMGQISSDFLHFPLTSFTFTHDRRQQCVLVSCFGDNSNLKLIDRYQAGSILNTYTGFRNRHARLQPAIDNTDSYIIAPSEDSSIWIYDILADKPCHVISNAHGDHPVNGVVTVNDNEPTRTKIATRSESHFSLSAMLSYGQDGKLKIWNHCNHDDELS